MLNCAAKKAGRPGEPASLVVTLPVCFEVAGIGSIAGTRVRAPNPKCVSFISFSIGLVGTPDGEGRAGVLQPRRAQAPAVAAGDAPTVGGASVSDP